MASYNSVIGYCLGLVLLNTAAKTAGLRLTRASGATIKHVEYKRTDKRGDINVGINVNKT